MLFLIRKILSSHLENTEIPFFEIPYFEKYSTLVRKGMGLYEPGFKQENN